MADERAPRSDNDDRPLPATTSGAPRPDAGATHAVAPPAAEMSALGQATRAPKSLARLGLEVLLIGTGVFLGLMGEQWRERTEHRELAEASLRRLRVEIVTNRATVADIKDYHVTLKARLDQYLRDDPKKRDPNTVQVRGLRPAFFERTAWELALVTQSLAYTDPQVAQALSRVYTLQEDYAELTRSMMQALYLRPPSENVDPYYGALQVYYGDVVLWEPRLLAMYDELLPQIDRALGEAPAPSSGR